MAYDERIRLNDGNSIPALGLGTWLIDDADAARAVEDAVAVGYRHIDTAQAYGNETGVGTGVRECGVPRSELFVTTKVAAEHKSYETAAASIDESLTRLGLDHVDLLIIHSPQPWAEFRAGDNHYHAENLEAWRAMEDAQAAGRVRSIGLSNFPIAKFQEILDVAEIIPAVHQVEAHPRWNQHELKARMSEATGTEVLVEAWYPLGHGDKTLLEEPAIAAAAQRTGATPAQVILAWHLAERNITFPKTLSPAHMADNLAALDVELTAAEIATINGIPQQPYYRIPDEPPAFVLTTNDYSQQA